MNAFARSTFTLKDEFKKFLDCILWIFWLLNDTFFFVYIDGTLYGPLHSQQGVDQYFAALEEAKAQGGKIECGGKVSLLEAMLIYCQIFYLKMGCWFFFF